MKFKRINESKPSPISIEEQERQKETRQVMNHLMNAEDELYTAMTSAKRMAKFSNNQVEREALDNCASYVRTASIDVASAKLAIRDLKMNESTKKLTNEGPGAGYDIVIKDVKIDKVIKFEESDYKSEYSSEKYYKYEASIKPGIYEIEANTYYDPLTSEDDNQVTFESGTIYGEVGIWNDPDDERTLEEKIRGEIEGYTITISTMYGGGWMHVYLPKGGNIEFDNVKFTPNSYSFTIDEFKFKSKEMATVINWNYDHIGEEEDDDDVDPEEVNESLKDGFTTNRDVTRKVDELVQAVWRDAQSHTDKKVATAAFRMFERTLDKAITDYWDFIQD